MTRLSIVGLLVVVAGSCEVGGGYLAWGWLRGGKPLSWAVLGAAVLALCGVVSTLLLQPTPEFRRV